MSVLHKWVHRFFWQHPEWWCVALAAAAWGATVAHALPPAAAHHGHVHHTASFQGELLSWGVMVTAMMAPLVLGPLRWLAFQSFSYRRHRAIFAFLIGFLVPWMAVGVVPAWLRSLGGGDHPLLASGLFCLAALWVLVPVRRRALVVCHRTAPLAPSGWKADRDCLLFGLPIGVSCVVTCGCLMLACAFTGHSLIAMVGGAVLSVLERRSFRPPTRHLVLGALLLALWFLLPI